MAQSPADRAKCRLVGTPIGNLSDMTPRAVQALRDADVVYAEDTRTAKALLHHLEISKPVKSYHKDNENEAAEAVIAELAAGRSVALISEAGMPGISDPGYLLIKRLLEEKIPHEVVPGVSAAVHAVVASGLAKTGQYLFYGFLPHKGAEKALEELVNVGFPIVFYESPHRIKETLKLLLKHFTAPLAVCRELTKLYEEVLHIYSPEDIENITVKGEFCIVVQPAKRTEEGVQAGIGFDAVLTALAGEDLPAKTAANVMKSLGMKRNAAYETYEELKRNK